MKKIRISECLLLIFALLFVGLVPVAAETTSDPLSSLQTDWSKIYFLGESTTAHLRRRGTRLGQFAKTNVISPDSGTLTLSSRTLSQIVRKTGTKEKTSILELLKEKQPPLLVLSFGLNGIVGFHANETRYLQLYGNLIEAIRQASPDTLPVLQTIYPVAKEQTTWKFANPPEQINLWIDSLNERLNEFCAEKGIPLWDTAALLRDEMGFLKPEFSADGIHLTNAAYDLILLKIAENTEKTKR